MDNYNYPEGSDTPNAPWNEEEPMTRACLDCDGPITKEALEKRTVEVCATCDGEGEIIMSNEEVMEHEANVKCMRKYGFVP